jgi:hypothetical protein
MGKGIGNVGCGHKTFLARISPLDYRTADDEGPFRPSKPGFFRADDPDDPGQENEALKNINKPHERQTAPDALKQDIPCGVNESRDHDQ